MRAALCFLVTCSSLCAGVAFAEDRIGVELRIGGAFPEMSQGELNIDTGVGFDGTLSYSLTSRIGVYGGMGWHQFSTDNRYLEQNGYNFGVELMIPIPKTTLKPRFRVGITYEEILLKNEIGATVENTEHGIGFEIDAAVPIDLGQIGDWRILPGISYRSLNRDVGVNGSVDLNYVALDLGVCIHF